MAGLIDNDDSLEGRSLLRTDVFNLENLLFPNHNAANLASSPFSDSRTPRTTAPRDALVTMPPSVLELRQNNPQDCSNLIIASVDRATVEISRTIIALNATFSQQLQQASISASNGIKSAQSSATSTIQVVVLSASSATSSAFSSLTIANLAVTSANFALTNAQSSASSVIAAANSSLTLANLAVTSISSASSSDVSTLSSSLSQLQASLTSVQSSASVAIAAAQSALAFATGSAAAQASSILASAARATQGLTTIAPQQSLPTLDLPKTISLTPAQAGAIVAGAVVLTVLLSFAIYLLAMKMKKRKERDSYLDGKDIASSPKKLPSRLSSTLRTGNAMMIKFNPPESSDAPPPSKFAVRLPEDFPDTSSSSNRKEMSQAMSSETNLLKNSSSSTYSDPQAWPLTSTSTREIDVSATRSLLTEFSLWPLRVDAIKHTRAASPVPRPPEPRTEPPTLNILDTVKTDDSIPYISSALKETFGDLDVDPDRNAPQEAEKNTEVVASLLREQTHHRRKSPGKRVFNPFEGGIEELPPEHVNEEQVSEPLVEEILAEARPVSETPERESYSETAQFFKALERPVNSFKESAQEPADDPIGDSSSQLTPKTLHEPPERPAEAPHEPRPEPWSFEKLPEMTRIPKPETLALLLEEDQARSSTMPEIDKLLRIVAQENDRLADKPLFWSDFRPVEEEIKMATEVPPVREHGIVVEDSPTTEQIGVVANESQRGMTLSPFLRKPAANVPSVEPEIFPPKQEESEFSTQREQPPPPHSSAEEKEILPLRMNPQMRNITSIIAEHEATSELQELNPEGEVDDHQARGRSMLRTSDIIEARLSAIIRTKDLPLLNTDLQELSKEERDQTISPLRRNPVDFATVLDQRNRTLSPLQRNPSTSTLFIKRKSRTLSPPSLPRLHHAPPSHSREESPLRRNPPSPIPSQPLSAQEFIFASNAALRPQSNFAFSQTLSKFQSLAEQGTVNGRQASTEVTQRAIAGIFIPGSLREQAVRNLSKSRERSTARGGEGKSPHEF